MANQKMNKTEGAVETCSSCGTQVYCRLKAGSGNFPAKLQWQNKDGKAHYFYDHSKPIPTKEQLENGMTDERFTCIPDNELGSSDMVQKALLQEEQVKEDAEQIVKEYEEANKPENATYSIIDRQNELLDIIEDRTTKHLKRRYGENVEGARIGMRVKEIYRLLSG